MYDQSFSKNKVLLVIKDESVQNLLVEYLSDIVGLEVFIEDSVSKAAAKIEEDEFLIVFLDWDLVKDNVEDIFERRSLSGKIPFVVLLIDESTSFDFSYPIGAFFLKPFSVKDLNGVMLRVLNGD